jgi:hypothetical protein
LGVWVGLPVLLEAVGAQAQALDESLEIAERKDVDGLEALDAELDERPGGLAGRLSGSFLPLAEAHGEEAALAVTVGCGQGHDLAGRALEALRLGANENRLADLGRQTGGAADANFNIGVVVDAASAITRLLDLGIEPFLLCSTLSGILAQRLVRLLCEQCRVAYEVEAAELIQLGLAVPGKTAGRMRAWRAQGCPRCQARGYHGRTGIFELLVVDHHIRSLIIKRTSTTQLRQAALARGMRSLWQAGWQYVHSGLTSLEELLRVLPRDLR